MTTEQATIFAAIIAALATTITLIVTVIGWWATHNSQKELLKMQVYANQQRDSWQQVQPARIQELREMKNWLQEGLRLRTLAIRDALNQDEVNEWFARASYFQLLAKRVDGMPNTSSLDSLNGPLTKDILSCFIGFSNYLLSPRTEWDTEFVRKVGNRTVNEYVPSAISKIDEYIAKIASQQYPGEVAKK